MWQCRHIYEPRDLTENIDLTTYQKVQLFYHLDEIHWTNVILYMPTAQILIFDSLALNDVNIDLEVRDFLSSHLWAFKKEYCPSKWKTVYVVPTGAPIQTNIHDCGIHVMVHMFTDYHKFTLTIPDIHLVRYALLNSFLLGELLPLSHSFSLQPSQYASNLLANTRATDWRHIVWVKLLPSQHSFHKLDFG